MQYISHASHHETQKLVTLISSSHCRKFTSQIRRKYHSHSELNYFGLRKQIGEIHTQEFLHFDVAFHCKKPCLLWIDKILSNFSFTVVMDLIKVGSSLGLHFLATHKSHRKRFEQLLFKHTSRTKDWEQQLDHSAKINEFVETKRLRINPSLYRGKVLSH